MSAANKFRPDEQFIQNSIGSVLRIGVLLIIAYYSLQIVSPFINLALWSIILAVALHPAYANLSTRLRNRQKLSAMIIVTVFLFIIVFPITVMTESTVASAKSLSSQLQSGELSIPPPRDKVASWPVIGETVYEVWSEAAENLEDTINQFEPQLTAAGEWLLKAIGGVAGGILTIIVSIILSGFFMITADRGYAVSKKIMTLLLGARGEEMTDLSIATIRSVAKGVLGVALIQTALAAVGLFAANVPYAGILLVIFLLIAIIQVPTTVIILPLIIWMYSASSPVVATVFAVYMILVGLSDNVLKPLLLGRGVQIPALVILLGAIGGMIYAGVIGLFLGAVILALAYTLVLVWMDSATEDEAATAE